MTKNRLLAVFPRLGKEWIVSFTLRLTSLSASSKLCSIIHVTQNGDKNYGDRIPAVFLFSKNEPAFKSIRIITSRDGENPFLGHPPVPEVNESMNIEIHQRYFKKEKYRVFAMINGEEFKSANNQDARQFEKVKVYAGSPWEKVCPGYIKNLAITNFT